jgi:hypothetical protein
VLLAEQDEFVASLLGVDNAFQVVLVDRSMWARISGNSDDRVAEPYRIFLLLPPNG